MHIIGIDTDRESVKKMGKEKRVGGKIGFCKKIILIAAPSMGATKTDTTIITVQNTAVTSITFY